MDQSLITILTSFVVSLIVTPAVIYYTVKKGIFVVPGRRKIHKRITPSLGGIGIFCGFLIASLFSLHLSNSRETQLVLVFITLTFLLGIMDDLSHLSAIKKLITQLMIIVAFIVLTDLRLVSFYGLASDAVLPYVVCVGLTVLVMVIIINSVNLIDGLDGLAGMISLISCLCFAGWFLVTGNVDYAYLLFALFGGIGGFIIFNWEPSKIFMGDTGSLVIGMILSIAAVKFINLNFSMQESPYSFRSSVTTAICFLSIPLIDTARIILIRIYKRQSPLRPDKNHIHHILIRLGASHSQTALLLGFMHMIFIVIAVFFRDVRDIILLPSLLIFAGLLCVLLDIKILKRLTMK